MIDHRSPFEESSSRLSRLSRRSRLSRLSRPRGRASFGSFAALVFALLLVLSACGSGGGGTSGGSGPAKGGTLTVGLDSDVVTLDPLKSTALVDREVMLNLYDTIVHIGQDGSIQPDLATSWDTSNPKQIVFTLRSGVKFQDGTPVDANAVVTNMQRILNTTSSPRHSELSAVTSVQAVDATHVQFNLKQPFAPLLATLGDRAGMILSPAVIQSAGAGLGNDPANAGSGPFEFSSWVKGSQLVMKANPNYWQKDSAGTTLPYLSQVTYKPITNGSVMYTNIETSTINVAMDLDPTDVASAKSNSNITYNQAPGLSFYGFELNTQSAPFNNQAVRQAISYAVNRDEIVSSVLKNIGVAAQGPIPPSSWAHSNNNNPYSYDVNKAKSLLSQAGVSSVNFTMLIASGSPTTTQMAQFLASEMAPAGITMNIQSVPFATLLSDSTSHNFQAELLGWSGRVDPDGNMYVWFHTGGGENDMQYSNSQVDSLLDDARIQTSQSARANDYQQAEKIIQQDAPYVFLYHGVSQEIVTNNVHNFQLRPDGIMYFSQVYLS